MAVLTPRPMTAIAPTLFQARLPGSAPAQRRLDGLRPLGEAQAHVPRHPRHPSP